MGSVEHDLQTYEHEQSIAYARDDYAVAHRDHFMGEAIDEEIREDFACDLEAAASRLIGAGQAEVQPFIEAFTSNDDCELGRLVRKIMEPVLCECAQGRAERMAAEEFDGGKR